MNKREFEEKIGKEIADSDYEIIEIVYAWHPVISNVDGKQQMADLYEIGGMTIIKDMLPRAEKAFELNQKMEKLEAELNKLRLEYGHLRD